MYYQIYNTETDKIYLTVSDYKTALIMLDKCNNPHYYDMHQQVYKIREIDEKDHPLFGEPGFDVSQEMDEEADVYDPEDEWVR